jgi:hypothetical protein
MVTNLVFWLNFMALYNFNSLNSNIWRFVFNKSALSCHNNHFIKQGANNYAGEKDQVLTPGKKREQQDQKMRDGIKKQTLADNQDTAPLSQTRELLRDMIGELLFRGCEEGHKLIRQAGELLPQLKKLETQLAGDGLPSPSSDPKMPVPVAPEKLHQLSAERVSDLNLSDLSAERLSPYSRKDLAEEAFTFENQLMALLEDGNTMPWETYAHAPEEELIRIIKSAVENICRLRC